MNNPADLGTKHLSEAVILEHLTALYSELRAGRADVASKLLNYVYGDNRFVKVAKDWDGECNKREWKLQDNVYSKHFKSARALRQNDEHGPRWSDVIHYRAVDSVTGEVLEDLDTVNIRGDEPRLQRKLPRPRDINVALTLRPSVTNARKEIQSNESSMLNSSEGGSSSIRTPGIPSMTSTSPELSGTVSNFVNDQQSSALAFGSSCIRGCLKTITLRSLPNLHGSAAGSV